MGAPYHGTLMGKLCSGVDVIETGGWESGYWSLAGAVVSNSLKDFSQDYLSPNQPLSLSYTGFSINSTKNLYFFP